MKTQPKSTSGGLAACLSAAVLALNFQAVADPASTYSGPEKTFTGDVVAVDLSRQTVKVRSPWLIGKQFSLGAACSYALLDGATDAPAALHPGQKISVIYQSVDGVLVADRIIQQRLSFSGWVQTVDRNTHTFTVQPGGFGLTRKFQYSDASVVTLLGDRTGTFADIQPGNHVSLTYEEPPGVATVQNIAQTSTTFTGELTAIDFDAKTVRAKTSFTDRSFELGKHCVIDLDGKGGGRLSDLRPDEKLVFTYDAINGVNVVNRIAPAKDSEESVSSSTPPGGS
jgi:uncharacterized protein YndB with AHSA1/START domain